MRIEEDKCVACLSCIEYCPVDAIKVEPENDRVFIDEDECVECGCCLRADVCASDAIWQPELAWPRRIRAEFSNPQRPHSTTGSGGRGTSESKTNDVTGRYSKERIGIAAEMGRPGIGACLKDIEKVTMAIASLGVVFEQNNPVYDLFSDPSVGKLKEEVLNEKVLSAIVEFATPPDKVTSVLTALRNVSEQIDTVFSVDMCCLLEPDGTCPTEDAVRAAGFEIRPNGKDNIGLGRPLAKF